MHMYYIIILHARASDILHKLHEVNIWVALVLVQHNIRVIIGVLHNASHFQMKRV
jgi:hypothetical protein